MQEYVANLEEAEANLFAIVPTTSPEYMADKERIQAFRYMFEE